MSASCFIGEDLFKMFTLKKHQPAICISDLHDDTLVEIMNRLPIKYIVSSKSVSKLWYRLISSICIPRITSCPVHAFIFNPFMDKKNGLWTLAWINSSNQFTSETSLIKFCHMLPFIPSPREFLCCCTGYFLFFHQSSMQYYLCNPSTEQYLAIPNSPKNEIPKFAALIFDPHCKIVQNSRDLCSMSIFSTETGEWAVYKIHIERSIIRSGLVSRHIFLDGFIYRLALSGHLLRIGVKEPSVEAIELPKVVVRGEDPIGCIGISQGVVHYSWGDEKSPMMVWILGEGGNTDKWIVKHTICHQYFVEHPLCSSSDDSPLFSVCAFDPTSDILFISNRVGIYQYDPRTKKLETVCRLDSGRYIYAGQYYVYPFSPNLNPLGTFSQTMNR